MPARQREVRVVGPFSIFGTARPLQSERATLRPFLIVAGLNLAAAMLFTVFPRMDLQAATLFHSSSGFLLEFPRLYWLVPQGVHKLGMAVGVLVAAGFLATWLCRIRLGPLGSRQFAYLILCFSLGPGLIANYGLKDHWGRARPRDITEFGGDRAFSTPLYPSHECRHNCSFVSGDVAFAATFLAFAMLFRRKLLPVVIVAAFATAVGVIRMMQGAHFLSDVVFSASFMALLVVGLHWLVLSRPLSTAPPMNAH